ncbi:hypothetical protein F5880DRAFT_1674734 [Lentinula raphanica]|nr:hypothetical protein F5880DRAFT_1674734 [Lentinula raphanica]
MSTQPLGQSPGVKSIFLLGATGYVGGQVLLTFAHDFPAFPIRALVRNVTPSKVAQLQSLHSKLDVVEGSLSDIDVIETESKNADVVIDVAVAGDTNSVNAILRGLQQRSRSYAPTLPPIYIHMSGTGITGDNARGDLYAPERLWVDTEFDLNHIKSDLLANACKAIVDAGRNGEIRTMVVLPGLIYGVGPGLQKISLPHRIFLDLASQAGHSGTFGSGRNISGYVHVKDVASAVSAVLKGALHGGKNGEQIGQGKEGFYFVLSKYMTSIGEFSSIIGEVSRAFSFVETAGQSLILSIHLASNVMRYSEFVQTLFKQGLIAKTGAYPFAEAIADKAGAFGYTIFGSSAFCRADRLTKELGWSAEHTEVESLYESLPKEVELAVKEMGLKFSNI